MFEFKMHTGDWLRDTMGLTPLQNGVYLRLVMFYYTTEGPLPLDDEALFRVAGAYSAEEREAVFLILRQFFKKKTGGFWHKKCEETIQKTKTSKANGGKGGRPPKAENKNLNHNLNETKSVTPINHKPLTINQEPETINLSFPTAAASEAAAVANEQKTHEFQQDPFSVNAIQFGNTPNDDFIDVSGKALIISRSGRSISEGEWLRAALVSEPTAPSTVLSQPLRLSDLAKRRPVFAERLRKWQLVPIHERMAAIFLVERHAAPKAPFNLAAVIVQRREADFLAVLDRCRQGVEAGDYVVKCT